MNDIPEACLEAKEDDEEFDVADCSACAHDGLEDRDELEDAAWDCISDGTWSKRIIRAKTSSQKRYSFGKSNRGR